MWRDVEWMTRADKDILEWMAAIDADVRPSTIARNCDYTMNYVSRRLQILLNHGMVEHEEPSWYWISDRGKAFLAGEILLEELQDAE